ncbi:hypothetical protein FGB62_8g28 [Gracilaria domingensis]|nr:hypothetical protein FGB62_8g28 [Gracilaria domingensis]
MLLAVRHFRPEQALMGTTQLSTVLNVWFQKIIAGFNIDPELIMSSTSDSGSDVNRLCSILMPGSWAWYLPHLLLCVLVEAFGTCLSSNNVRNNGSCSLLKDVESVIEHIHKSKRMGTLVEDMQIREGRRTLKLLHNVLHRCLSTVRMLEKFLSLWDTLVKHYERHEQTFFPVANDHKVLLELFSIMLLVSETVVMSQSTTYPSSIESFLALCLVRTNLLRPEAVLSIYDPASKGYNGTRKIQRVMRAVPLAI